MSGEATITSLLQINKNNLKYLNQGGSFTADIVGTAKGPTPGAIAVSVSYTVVNLSQLTTPGLCRISSLEAATSSNVIQVGIYDSQVASFYPLMELLPGESYVIRLSRLINKEILPGTGTSVTDSTPEGSLALKSSPGVGIALVEAFER